MLFVVSRTGKINISCPRSRQRIWSRVTDSAVPVSLLVSILRLNLVLTYGITPEFRDGVILFISNHHTSEAHINWSMVTCQGSTRSELP